MMKYFRLTVLACAVLVLQTWDFPVKRNLFAAPAPVETKGPVAPGDSARTVIPMTANAQRYLTYYNTLIKEGELTS